MSQVRRNKNSLLFNLTIIEIPSFEKRLKRKENSNQIWFMRKWKTHFRGKPPSSNPGPSPSTRGKWQSLIKTQILLSWDKFTSIFIHRRKSQKNLRCISKLRSNLKKMSQLKNGDKQLWNWERSKLSNPNWRTTWNRKWKLWVLCSGRPYKLIQRWNLRKQFSFFEKWKSLRSEWSITKLREREY